jgi:hypothetical protein
LDISISLRDERTSCRHAGSRTLFAFPLEDCRDDEISRRTVI